MFIFDLACPQIEWQLLLIHNVCYILRSSSSGCCCSFIPCSLCLSSFLDGNCSGFFDTNDGQSSPFFVVYWTQELVVECGIVAQSFQEFQFIFCHQVLGTCVMLSSTSWLYNLLLVLRYTQHQVCHCWQCTPHRNLHLV